MRICHLTEASDPSFGGLYTATRGLAGALSRFQHVESPVVTGLAFGACSTADVCHAHGMWGRSALVSLLWGLRHRKPLVIAPHGMLDGWALARRAAVKRMALATYEGLRLHRAACLHALCEAELASIERLGIEAPVFVIPNGVDVPDAAALHAARAAAVSANGWKTLLYLGRVDPKKGIELALHALGGLMRADPRLREEWRVQVCGPGDAGYLARLGRLTRELGLSGVVQFAGPVRGDEKDRILGASSGFFLTSYSEGLPMAVLEAWACGLPTVISHECNLSRPASDGAAVVAHASPDDVTRAFRVFFSMSDRDRGDMGARARRHVERAHRWDHISMRMMQVYRWILGDGPRPDPS
jgi:glycosyltransferase involved in cell wall biosynthesis